MILLHGSPPDAVVTELVARLRQRVATPITSEGVTAAVGITVGLSRTPVADAETHELLDQADEARYARKGSRASG